MIRRIERTDDRQPTILPGVFGALSLCVAPVRE
jgi:hypothetical protein